MWRDVALTNKKNIANALLKLEQRLAHIRENLDSKAALRGIRSGAQAKETAAGEQEITDDVGAGVLARAAVAQHWAAKTG